MLIIMMMMMMMIIIIIIITINSTEISKLLEPLFCRIPVDSCFYIGINNPVYKIDNLLRKVLLCKKLWSNSLIYGY